MHTIPVSMTQQDSPLTTCFFGHHPRWPIDMAFGIDLNKGGQSPRQYVQEMKQTLKRAYQTASENMKKRAAQNKVRYDKGAQASELEPGDRVLVRKLGPRLATKVDDRWETEVYVVERKAEGVPVYVVNKETGKGTECTLHRNYLLPIGMLSDEIPERHKPETEKTREIIQKERQGGNRRPQKIELVEAIEDEDCTVEITVTPQPVVLRAEAPEFIPVGEQRPLEDKMHAEDVQEEIYPRNGDDHDPEEQQSPEEEFDVQGDEEEMKEDDEELEDPNSFIQKKPTPLPRRSLRSHHPVDRLNLLHRCRSVDGDLGEGGESSI